MEIDSISVLNLIKIIGNIKYKRSFSLIDLQNYWTFIIIHIKNISGCLTFINA